MFKKLLITLLLLATLATLPVLAQVAPPAPTPPAPTPAAVAPPALIGGAVLPGVGTTIATGDAAGKFTFLRDTFITQLTKKVLEFIAALAVTFLVVGAYQYLTAVGNDEQIKQAHKTIMWSLVGLALALLAFAIVQVVISINFGAPPPATTP